MKFVVAGFGKFGRIAVERLEKAYPGAGILIIEQDRSQTQDIPSEISINIGDCSEILATSSQLEPDDVVIPMVPFNLAAGYILRKRSGTRRTPLPEQITAKVPNPYVLDDSNLACSKADFLCPDNCPEGEACTVTGKPRAPLYEEIQRISVPNWRVLVQRSFQILPGVGGYTLESLQRLESQIGSGCHIVATSCKCHAVLTSLIGTRD